MKPRFFFICFLLAGLVPATAIAQDTPSCETVLEDGRDAYFAGAFQEAIDLLNACIAEEHLNETELLQGYLLVAQAYYALDATEDARGTLESLFTLSPEFEPETRLPPPFLALLNEVKNEVAVRLPPAPPIAVENPTATDSTVTVADSTGLPPENNRRSRRPLFIAGSGVLVAAGVLTAVLSRRGSTGSDTEFALPTRPTR